MALFEPDLEERRLGYVRHTYTKGKIWQEIGNFFIGLAPLAGGTLALLLLSWLLYPQLVDPFFNPSNQNIQAVSEDSTYKKDSISAQPNNTNPGNPAKQTNNPAKVKDPWIGFGDLTYGVGLGFQSLFSFSNLISWRFWLFLYLVTCVSVHMAPSASDYQGAKNGGWILLGIWLAAHLVHGLLGMSMEAWGWFFWPYWLQAIGTLVVASGLGTVVVVMVFLVTEIWDLFFDRSKLA